MNKPIIEAIWAASGASPDYLAAMRLALVNKDEGNDNLNLFSTLPGLCCEAAGGDPSWANDISIGWNLIYTAAHLFDIIQDQDEIDPFMEKYGTAAAINVATGLVITGLAIVNQLHQHLSSRLVANAICDRFYNVGIKMSSGQHRDLITERPGVEEWKEIAEAKSGSFFGLACWSGARLATSDARRLNGFSHFGAHLGVLLQIHDDLADLGDLREGKEIESTKWITRSLPFAYALDVSPKDMRERLYSDLHDAQDNEEAYRGLVDLLDRIGAALYLKIQIEQYQQRARAVLEEANPDPVTRDRILALLDKLK